MCNLENIIIRNAILSDLPYLYEICLKTGDAGKDATTLYNDPYLLGNYYVAPYVNFRESICFVAEYNNRPQGYIVSVPNTVTYKQWLEDYWLPPLRKQFPIENNAKYTMKEETIVNLIHKKQYPIDQINMPYIKDYPSHLHVDILPVIQGKGVGNMLMNCLCKELKSQNVSGLHLSVGFTNPGAIKFYQKMDFTVIKEYEWGYTMGKLL